MSQTPTVAYLRRAYGLITGVSEKTEDLRQHVLAHEASAQQDQPFVAGMVSTFQSGRRLGSEKANLKADLDLAISEIDRAQAADPDAAIDTKDGTLQAKHLRANALLLHGVIEGLHGTSALARQYLGQSIQVADSAGANYWMALLYEGDHDPANALAYYERCLALDPDGEYSVAALRSANEMRNYRKKFRGSWGMFGCLLLLFFPVAIVYYVVKTK